MISTDISRFFLDSSLLPCQSRYYKVPDGCGVDGDDDDENENSMDGPGDGENG